MSYALEWAPLPVVLGAVVLPLIGPLAMIAVLVVALAALAALVALAGAILASPYLLVRSVRRRLAQRRESTAGTGRTATTIARSRRATRPSGVAVLANPTPARRSG
jgi:membrane protein implicated in regulation of membrane protease activity